MNFKEYCENLLNEGWIETSTTEYLKKYLQDVKGIRQKTKLAIEAELRKRGNQDQKLNQESFIQKDLNAAMIKLSHLKKEMYKASPGLRDTYQGEIDNLKSYINNLKQSLRDKDLQLLQRANN